MVRYLLRTANSISRSRADDRAPVEGVRSDWSSTPFFCQVLLESSTQWPNGLLCGTLVWRWTLNFLFFGS